MGTKEQQRILIVDDDKGIRQAFGAFLKFAGYAVTDAGTAEEGLAKLETVRPDLILLDINMPGMGGIGFIKQIMRDHGEMPYPVLVFTTREELETFFNDAPVAGFLVKPCEQSELVDKVHSILDERRPEQEQGGRILIGEDEGAYAERLVRVFSNAGYEVERVATGPELLEKTVSSRPDAIVVKRILTRMNGDAVAAMLQTMPGTRAIPVILYHENPVAGGAGDTYVARSPNVKYLATHTADDLLQAVRNALQDTQTS